MLASQFLTYEVSVVKPQADPLRQQEQLLLPPQEAAGEEPLLPRAEVVGEAEEESLPQQVGVEEAVEVAVEVVPLLLQEVEVVAAGAVELMLQ